MKRSLRQRTGFSARTVFITLMLAFCCAVCFSKSVKADTEGDYTYEVSDDKATISKYTGTDTTFTIPSQLGGYDVTAIGDNAFSDTKIVSVAVPSSVSYVGIGAFCDCDELTSISLPDTLTLIEDSTFLGCKKLNNVTIPSGVTIIRPFAFSECSSLTAITLPASLTHIYNDAFTSCSSLESFTITANVSYIDPNAFVGCTSLKEFKVSASSVYFVAEDGVLFDRNKSTLVLYPAGKTNVAYQLPSTVTSIGSYAFSNTAVTQKVFIPETVTTFSSKSFYKYGSQLRICASTGSYALTYAKNYGIPYSSAESYVAVTGLELTGDSVVWVPVSQKTYQVNVKVLPSNASDTSINYTSSDSKVATVNDAGLVTFKSTGFTIITASYGDYKKQVSLTVEEASSEDSSATTTTTAPTTPTTPTVVKTNIADNAISVHLSTTSYAYNGTYKKPAVTVYNGQTPIDSSNYTVAYANNKSIGTATVTVTGINQCYGSRTVTFKIVPPTVTKVKLSGKKKAVSASWGKVSSASGYQVYYSTKKASGYKRAKSIATNKAVKYKISKLSAKKTYYIRIRAYKKVGKTIYYGAFSTVKKVKTK